MIVDYFYILSLFILFLDARIQMIVCVYAGKPRTRCWRRLDLVSRSQPSLAEQHAHNLSQHRSGGNRPSSSSHVSEQTEESQVEPDWLQRMATGGVSSKGISLHTAKSGLA